MGEKKRSPYLSTHNKDSIHMQCKDYQQLELHTVHNAAHMYAIGSCINMHPKKATGWTLYVQNTLKGFLRYVLVSIVQELAMRKA